MNTKKPQPTHSAYFRPNSSSPQYTRLTHMRQKSSGMASITVTLILMLVISLIVIGFATLSRREQRQTLDQQLSTQAFYAAESGVNDIAKAIQDAVDGGADVATLSKTSCDNPTGSIYESLSQTLGSGVSYTCALVNATPPSIEYEHVNENPVVAMLATPSGTIGRLNITWSPSDDSSTTLTNCPSGGTMTGKFLTSDDTGWRCAHGVLRVDLVRTDGALTRANMMNQSNAKGNITVYLVPQSSGGSSSIAFNGSLKTSHVIGVPCNASAGSCTFTFNGVNTDRAAARVSSVYRESNVSIEGRDNANRRLGFAGAQVLVDVTGKARDVLRRIQVRLPMEGSGSSPWGSALQSNLPICKRFMVGSGYIEIPNDIAEPQDTHESMCNGGFSYGAP